MDHFLAIDEEGYFLLQDNMRLTDEEVGYDIFKNLQINPEKFDQITSLFGNKPVIVEAFDKPLIAQQIFKEHDNWSILMPYGWRENFQLKVLCLDAWDRFHGLTDRGIPFTFSRKAQAEFFNLLDNYDDTSITSDQKTYTMPDFYIEDSSADTQEFWSQHYQEMETPPWDLGKAHPALEPILPQLKILKSRIINFGCGKGHDAAFLADKGHVVTAVDISQEAVKMAQKKYSRLNQLTFEQADIFNRENELYDMCFEHTLFCAIPPSKRKELIKKWYSNLDEGGFLLGIFFVMPWRKGPPYGCSEWELRSLLEKKFRLLYWKRWQQSPNERQGSELVIFAQKKDT